MRRTMQVVLPPIILDAEQTIKARIFAIAARAFANHGYVRAAEHTT